MRRGIFTLLSIITAGSLLSADYAPLKEGLLKKAIQIQREYEYYLAAEANAFQRQHESYHAVNPSYRAFPSFPIALAEMKESQVLLLNIVPTGVYNNKEQLDASDRAQVPLVMLELAKKKNVLLKTLIIDMGPRTLERDPKTGSQLWRTREFRLELQKLVNHLVKPPFNKDEFGFAKPIYRDYVLYLPPIHFLIGKNGEVLDRWSSYKEKLTVEDIIKRVNKVALKLKGG